MTIEREVAGLRCGEVLAELSDYFDGDLTEARGQQLEAHLHGCDVCERFGSAFTAAIRSLHEETSAAPEEATGLLERLRRRLAATHE